MFLVHHFKMSLQQLPKRERFMKFTLNGLHGTSAAVVVDQAGNCLWCESTELCTNCLAPDLSRLLIGMTIGLQGKAIEAANN